MAESVLRFACPSVSLALTALLRKSTGVLWVCLGLGVAIHLSFTAIRSLEAEQKVSRPLTTQFVKRQPRLTKPLELKKRPQPKRRRVERQMVAVRARARDDRVGVRLQPGQVLRGLARPDVRIGRVVGSGGGQAEPEAFAGIIEGAKDLEEKLDMSLELLDIETLDTGKYHAMVIQNPSDRRDITGFLYLYVGYSVAGWSDDPGMHGGYFERPTALPRLVEAINTHTRIRATYKGAVAFTAPEIANTPWLYTSVDAARAGAFRITRAEALGLGTYMISGGFFFVEDATPEIGGICDRTARSMIEDALDAINKPFRRDWVYQALPRTHPIYHCFFDFPGGPPRGLGKGSMYSPEDGLEGVYVDKRLVAIFSGNDYEDIWAGPGTQFAYINPERQYQFGVNLIVYALTQEGSITRRLMEGVQ